MMPEKKEVVFESQADLDKHDDLTEERLLIRLERDGLLREGLTWFAAREALDA